MNGKVGVNMSLLIFRLDKKGLVYSEQLLHADEIPYFVSGE